MAYHGYLFEGVGLGSYAVPNVIVRPYPRREIAWHRKKRIAKKWRKRYGPRYTYPKVNLQEILYSEQTNTVYCYPAMERQVRKALQQRGSL